MDAVWWPDGIAVVSPPLASPVVQSIGVAIACESAGLPAAFEADHAVTTDGAAAADVSPARDGTTANVPHRIRNGRAGAAATGVHGRIWNSRAGDAAAPWVAAIRAAAWCYAECPPIATLPPRAVSAHRFGRHRSDRSEFSPIRTRTSRDLVRARPISRTFSHRHWARPCHICAGTGLTLLPA